MEYRDIRIESRRGTAISCSVLDAQVDSAKLVLFVHGFKANRHEDGRFTQIAKNLAPYGVSSISMSFAGCPDSDEDFINYTIINDLDDIESAYRYMLENHSIDAGHVGIIGYSMGGRLAALFADRHPEIRTMGIFAGATQTIGIDDEFLGERMDVMKKEADVSGYFNYYNAFDDTYLKLSRDLLDECMDLDPMACLKRFAGNAIILHGSRDITVDPTIGKKSYDQLTNAESREICIIADADHGFGQWDNHPEQSKELVDRTSDFFIRHL